MSISITQDQNSSISESFAEIKKLEEKLRSVVLPRDLLQKGLDMLKRLENVIKFGGYSQEFEPIAKYIEWITQIPWRKYTRDNLDIDNVKEELDKHHYGLEDTKLRILEYLAVMKLNTTETSDPQKLTDDNQVDVSTNMQTLKGSSANAPILCFVGIQGIGKTSMAKSIANALGRKFYRISLGGLTSVTALRGIARGNPDAEPGQVVKGLVRTKVMNPLILFDEVDKVSEQSGARADVMASLLEILDPEQNTTFIDHYIDFPIDLSQTMFITTANNIGGISVALLDRLEVIRFSSYSDDDKIQIGKFYILPKVKELAGLSSEDIIIEDNVWPLIVRPLGFDAGIRELERTITRLCRKVAMMKIQGKVDRVLITTENFRQFIPEDFGIVG